MNKRIIISALAALGFSGPVFAADELSICTNYAETVITGGRTNCGFMQGCDAEEWREKAAKAGYSCDPIGPYLEIAKIRLQHKDEVARNAPPPPPPPQKPEYRPFQQQKRTTCQTNGNITTCTEN